MHARPAAPEDVRTGEPLGGAAQSLDGGDHLGIDFARQHFVGDLHCRFIGHALALDEIGLKPRLLHRPRDGLAAAMNHHRVDPHRFQENDVARDAVANLRVRRVHEAAAVLDDKRRAAEFLDVGQRLQQRVGFGNEVLHVKRKELPRPREGQAVHPNGNRHNGHNRCFHLSIPSDFGLRPSDFTRHPPSELGSLTSPLLNAT